MESEHTNVLVIDRRGGDVCRGCGLKHDQASTTYGSVTKHCLEATRDKHEAAMAKAREALQCAVDEYRLGHVTPRVWGICRAALDAIGGGK